MTRTTPLTLMILAMNAFAVMACGAPTIDGSSDESLEESVEEVRSNLDEVERDQFDQALMTIALASIDVENFAELAALGPNEIARRARNQMDGKTAGDVIRRAAEIKAEQERRQREQALQEIEELRRQKQQAADAAERLTAFEVLRSRFQMRERRYLGAEPIIELTVRNGTNHAVSRAYFRGTLASPGRSVPWIRETFNYSIPGGLEPAEEATWTLAPNMFSEWGTVDAPADAVLTVNVLRIDGPDGEPLYDAQAWTEENEERLTELVSTYSS